MGTQVAVPHILYIQEKPARSQAHEKYNMRKAVREGGKQAGRQAGWPFHTLMRRLYGVSEGDADGEGRRIARESRIKAQAWELH